MLKKIKENLNWNTLSVLGKNKFIKSFYIYLIITPIIAKLLSKIKETFPDFDIYLERVLPFSWKMFFFSALFFTIANLLYSYFSPRIIFENDNYHDFVIRKYNINHLKKYAENIKLYVSDNYRDLMKLSIKNYESSIYIMSSIIEAPTKKLITYDSDSKNEINSDIFYFLYDKAKNYRMRIILAISTFYFLGILLFLIVFLYQLSYVIKEI